ncbi:lytic transglycosylase domain-containing protein [Paucibacter soli]|uniref:lytic transglycosylase domain-containing protein n=1 Tax=Paucibacter soli TaxID=3133433 RepID=UPI0030A982AD
MALIAPRVSLDSARSFRIRPTLLWGLILTVAVGSASSMLNAQAAASYENKDPVIQSPEDDAHQKKLAERLALSSYISERWNVKEESARRVVDIVNYAALAHELDPLLVLAVVARESAFQFTGNHFDHRLSIPQQEIDPDTAHGLMQVAGRFHPEKMPIDQEGRRRLTTDEENVLIGSQILSEYLALERGNVERALQRYNGNLVDTKRRFASYVLRVKSDFERAISQA